ncbi:putative mediator of RNA polymerase II transcription subunit 29 [Athalia rosae]|uniref:putative mediator of RNA polymerase II transcription subunit 29 n=1 Tax=Athalia rosae TaxID=37344 RepID=UPI00203335CF|nr:putative mediator of RNA polymerase II transcription subunit 29 [Athalia rosae]
MSEIDAKVNMSLDEIIKMEKKDKKNKKTAATNGKGGGVKRNRGGGARGRGNFRGRGARNVKQNGIPGKTSQSWRLNRNQNQNLVQGGYVKQRFNKNGGLTRSRSNLNLNRVMPKNNTRGGLISRRGRGGRAGGLNRSRSRTNLTYIQGGFYTNNNGNNANNNKNLLKRTNSLPNLRDPTSVHNRLGYQSPAQIAYRNRVKRAKQVLLQRQNQRLNRSNDFRMPQAGKPLTTLQQRALERRQQILTSQRRFSTGGLRSDQIVRAQRHAQYQQKLMRMNAARINTSPNVNFMCTLGNNYTRGMRQRSMSLSRNQGGSANNLRQLPRGRSPFRQTMQSLNMIGRSQLFAQPQQQQQRPSRSRSRSRSRTRNVPIADSGADVDDRTFSEVMYSLSGNLGVTGRTLNDRFSF